MASHKCIRDAYRCKCSGKLRFIIPSRLITWASVTKCKGFKKDGDRHLPCIARQSISANQSLTSARATKSMCNILCVSGAALLTACTSVPRIEQVHVAVPVPCQQTVPVRPVMPTEALALDTTLDAFVAAAIAELERREGYEGQLRAALAACTAPVQ